MPEPNAAIMDELRAYGLWNHNVTTNHAPGEPILDDFIVSTTTYQIMSINIADPNTQFTGVVSNSLRTAVDAAKAWLDARANFKFATAVAQVKITAVAKEHNWKAPSVPA